MLKILTISLLFYGIAACDSQIEVSGESEAVEVSKKACEGNAGLEGCESLEPDFNITKVIPMVARPGEEVTLLGENFAEGMIVKLADQEISVKVDNAQKASFIAPASLAAGRLDALAVKVQASVPFSFYALTEEKIPLSTKAPSEVCQGEKFYNANGELSEGLRSCSEQAPACKADGAVGCLTTEQFKAADMGLVLSGNIINGVTIAGIAGVAAAEAHVDCAADAETGCIANNAFKAADMSAVIPVNIRSSSIIAGVSGSYAGSNPNCSSDGEVACVTTSNFKAADMSNVLPANIRGSVQIAGVTGTYPSLATPLAAATGTSDLTSLDAATAAGSYEFFDSTGARHTGTVVNAGTVTPNTADQTFNAGIYRGFTVKGDADLTAGNIKTSVEIFNVTGNLNQESHVNCGADGSTGCVATASYPAADASVAVAGNIKAGVTIAGQLGTMQAAPSDCSSDGQTSCVAVAAYKAVDMSKLTEGNIKNGVTIAGVAGLYPSGGYRLAGADSTADLELATFNAQIKAAADFEWFNSQGQHLVRGGDNDIRSSFILSGIDIFGATGTYAPGIVTISDLEATPSTGVISLAWNYSGSNVIVVRRTGASVTWQPSHGIEYAVGSVDGSHEIVYQGPANSYNDTTGSEGTFYYYKAYAYNDDILYSGVSNEVNSIFSNEELCGSASDGCYDDAAAITAGIAKTYSGKHIEYITNALSVSLWKEVGGSRILRPNGRDQWAMKLNLDGKGLSATPFSDVAIIAGRKCMTHVYVDDSDKFSTGNCLYYHSGQTNNALNAAGTSQVTDGSIGLSSWSGYNGGQNRWYVGNIQTCAAKGMRLPTMFETTTTATSDSKYPTGDGAPTFAQGNGIPAFSGNTFSATGTNSLSSSYNIWNGTSLSNSFYSTSHSIRCVLP